VMTDESRPITDADWDEIKTMMDRVWGEATLMIDGYKVTLQQQLSKRKIVTTMYVNGQIKGAWLSTVNYDSPEPQHEVGRRFFMPRSKGLYSAKDIKGFQKICGKKKAKEFADKRMYWLSPTWNSARSLRKHLEANNKEIRIVKIGMV